MLIGCALIAWVIWLQQKQVGYEEQERETNADRVKWLQTADFWMHHPAESMPEVLECLRGEDELARRSAALTLSQIGPNVQDWLPDVLLLMDDEDPFIRQSALTCLSRMGIDLGPWTEAIAARLLDDDNGVREAAARAIAHIGVLASPAVSRALVSCDPSRRALLMTILSHLGTEDPEALATIHETLRDETADPTLRWVAFLVLHSLERLDADDVEAVLRNSEPVPDPPTTRSRTISHLEWTSVRAISELHLASPSLLDAYMRFLARYYQREGVKELADIPDRDPRALDLISAAWNLGVDQSQLLPGLRKMGWGRSSVHLLREINRNEALRLLPEFLEQASDLARKDCWSGWSCLQGMGPDAAVCVPFIIERLRLRLSAKMPGWEGSRYEAIRMITEIGPGAAEAVPDLIALISIRNTDPKSKPSSSLDTQVLGALACIGPAARDAVPVIIAWLNDPPRELSSNGSLSEPHSPVIPIDALRRIAVWSPEVAECLNRLRKHAVPNVRESALVALSELDPDPSRRVDALVFALDDPNCIVRGAAAAALGRIGQPARDALPALRSAAALPENAVPPEVLLLGDTQILSLASLPTNYYGSEYDWSASIPKRTVREKALEAIRLIESNTNP